MTIPAQPGQPQPTIPGNSHNTPSMHMLCRQAPVLPVLIIENLHHAVPLAEALVAGGLPVLEVSLRGSAAVEAISLMSRVPGATIGAGMVLTPQNARDALDAGATFAASPGASHSLIDCCRDLGLPLLPGAISPTEVMSLQDRGFDLIKFFPAAASGGVAALKSLGGSFPQVHFCPAGGISQANAPDYLSLPNVACVGGSWMASAKLMEEEQWGEIRKLAHLARQLETNMGSHH